MTSLAHQAINIHMPIILNSDKKSWGGNSHPFSSYDYGSPQAAVSSYDQSHSVTLPFLAELDPLATITTTTSGKLRITEMLLNCLKLP
jgi:hypothetical protein